MEDWLGLVIFIIVTLVGLAGKLAKKPEDGAPPSSENPNLEDIPEVIRRMFTGGAEPPVARPASPPKEWVDDDGWQPVPPVTIPKPKSTGQSYQPPVARPAAPRVQQTECPQEGPRQRRPVVSPPAKPRPVAQRAPSTMKKVIVQRQAQTVPPAPARSTASALPPARTQEAQKPGAPEKKKMPVPARTGSRRGAGTLLQDLDDVRRGIILQEVLGPPVSMR